MKVRVKYQPIALDLATETLYKLGWSTGTYIDTVVIKDVPHAVIASDAAAIFQCIPLADVRQIDDD